MIKTNFQNENSKGGFILDDQKPGPGNYSTAVVGSKPDKVKPTTAGLTLNNDNQGSLLTENPYNVRNGQSQ